LAVDGKSDTTLPNCAIMDNYYVETPIWMVDLGKEMTINGVVVVTWQGAGQGNITVAVAEQSWYQVGNLRVGGLNLWWNLQAIFDPRLF